MGFTVAIVTKCDCYGYSELSVLLDIIRETGGEVSEHVLKAIVEKLERDWLDDVTCKVTMSDHASSVSNLDL